MTFLKNRPQGKKMGIILLVALIIISLADIIFRATAVGLDAVLTTSNLGEQLAVIALAVTILILTAKGKDRACYICYGAWAAYFIFDQLFELPGMVTQAIHIFSLPNGTLIQGEIGLVIRIASMVAIVAIGALLTEYLVDGTIYNRAFNGLCITTVLLLVVAIAISLYDYIFVVTSNGFGSAFIGNSWDVMLDAFNNIYRIIMVFMLSFFAYDSAKAQLKKTDLTK